MSEIRPSRDEFHALAREHTAAQRVGQGPGRNLLLQSGDGQQRTLDVVLAQLGADQRQVGAGFRHFNAAHRIDKHVLVSDMNSTMAVQHGQ